MGVPALIDEWFDPVLDRGFVKEEDAQKIKDGIKAKITRLTSDVVSGSDFGLLQTVGVGKMKLHYHFHYRAQPYGRKKPFKRKMIPNVIYLTTRTPGLFTTMKRTMYAPYLYDVKKIPKR